MHQYSTVNDFNFANHKALVRVDFNVPLNAELQVSDDSRIRAAVPTIQKIVNDGGRVILMSHLGRPKEGPVDKYSLKHVTATLSALLNQSVLFSEDCIGEEARKAVDSLKPGEVLLLENLRFHKEEEKGDPLFAAELASLGDVYVNDAFGTAHRAHASTAIIASHFKGKAWFGYLMAAELENASKVMTYAEKPFTAIMGGAKVSDKILIIEQLLPRINHLIIGGGMAYTFIKAGGGHIGKSLCEEDKLELALEILEKARESGVAVHLPVDSVNGLAFDNNTEITLTDIRKVPDNFMGLDIGPESSKLFSEVILGSKTLLWNGPMGVFEMENFSSGTRSVAAALAKATSMGAFSLIGGGDSAAAINRFGLAAQVSYVSTGGGALLEYFEGKELPGVAMLLEAQREL